MRAGPPRASRGRVCASGTRRRQELGEAEYTLTLAAALSSVVLKSLLGLLDLVVSGLFDLLSLVEMPVVGLGIPGLGPELDNVWVGHLVHGFSEVDVHFPVARVEGAVVEFELEGGSVPDVVVALGDSDGVLGPGLDDPGSLLLVAVPPHEAAGLEAGADQNDLLGEVGSVESEIA